jgi:hypothetical protein
MPEMTIRLRYDPASGKRDVVVKLHSDADTLPAEHEQLHRSLVGRLIEGGLLKAGDAGRLVVERDADPEGTTAGAAAATDDERRAARSGQ